MTAPALAAIAAGGHRVYRWQGREFPSVTAILAGGIPKPFLARWAAKAAAEYAINQLDRLALLPARQAIREIKQAPWATRDAAADLGNLLHTAVEAHATGRPRPQVPDHAAGYLAGFDQFLVAQPRPPGREVTYVAVLLGVLLGVLLIFVSLLASIWLQERGRHHRASR
jgi:hypothetical protein